MISTVVVGQYVLFTGIQVAYFTATFPYIMLTVLVVRGTTLDGASEGILYFITPHWNEFANAEVRTDVVLYFHYTKYNLNIIFYIDNTGETICFLIACLRTSKLSANVKMPVRSVSQSINIIFRLWSL